MKKKGLCLTCLHDRDCDFPRKFPVWQCEEFDGYGNASQKIKNSTKRKQKKFKREESLTHV